MERFYRHGMAGAGAILTFFVAAYVGLNVVWLMTLSALIAVIYCCLQWQRNLQIARSCNAAFDLLGASYVILDNREKLIHCSANCAALLGVALSEANKTPSISQFPLVCVNALRRQLSQLAAGGQSEREIFVLPRNNRDDAYISLKASVLSGFLAKHHYVFVFEDGSKCASQEIQYKKHLQNVLDAIPEPICIKDAASRYIVVNTAFSINHSLDKYLCRGQSSIEAARNRTGEEEARRLQEEDVAVLNGETINRNKRSTLPNGEEVHRLVSKNATIGCDGEPIIVVSSYNITK